MPESIYQERIVRFGQQKTRLEKQLAALSFTRLILFLAAIGFGYLSLVKRDNGWLYLALALVGLFIFCIRWYDRLQQQADFAGAMKKVNEEELLFAQEDHYSSATGHQFINPQHPYSYDLDLFGDRSLFAFLNRTTTRFGQEKLAGALLHADTNSIIERQEAVRELTAELDFRQKMQASGMIHPVAEKDLQILHSWLQAPPSFTKPLYYRLLVVFPVLTLGLFLSYVFSENQPLLTAFFVSCGVNLAVTFAFLRSIRGQLSISSTITGVLAQFANQLRLIEDKSFASSLLRQWQSNLHPLNSTAARSIQQLASLFGYLEFVLNLVVSIVLNGLSLFHVHILFGLDRWKARHSDHVYQWLEVIGEFEAIHSFANFSYNYPAYAFPVLRREEGFAAKELGHPLIRTSKRINNDLSLVGERFIILTGSNMSGKSTFLRTLGINLVLARAGSVVCAREISLYPYDLHVSMRISDSLQDSESLFYAELKRLQGIIRHLESDQKTFVILDEILRGTNSMDKHSGTAGLITRLATHRVCGVIATHDLSIAEMTEGYPGYMVNKCFESEIVNDELVFDYRIKNGVCSKLNASYLMKKMEII